MARKKVDIARVQGSEDERRAIRATAERDGMRVGPWLLFLGLREIADREAREDNERADGTK